MAHRVFCWPSPEGLGDCVRSTARPAVRLTCAKASGGTVNTHQGRRLRTEHRTSGGGAGPGPGPCDVFCATGTRATSQLAYAASSASESHNTWKRPRATQPVLESCVCIAHARACTHVTCDGALARPMRRRVVECQIVQDPGVLSICCSQCSNRPRCAPSLLDKCIVLVMLCVFEWCRHMFRIIAGQQSHELPRGDPLWRLGARQPDAKLTSDFGGLVPPSPLVSMLFAGGAPRGEEK